MRRSVTLLLLIAVLVVATASVAFAAPVFPNIIPLPNGWQPEGIASGSGTSFYVGSLVDGAIYQGDFRTGMGAVLIPGQAGRSATGLKFDPRSGYLFVSGAATGAAYVYDTRTGEEVAAFQFAAAGNFINDVVITRSAAYFTNSSAAVIYKVPLSANGQPLGTFETIPLSGDWTQVPNSFNANGIDATPNGDTLIIVNTIQGALYRVDPDTGVAHLIVSGGLANGDGILLQGKTLYVVRNQNNEIAVVELAPDLSSGSIVDTITDPAFRVPTTIARFGSALYAVNARFGTPPTPDTQYEVVRVRR